MASRIFHAAILGAPASGKGTISSRIVKKFNIVHIASGDLLRQHMKDETDIGKEASKLMQEGHLVPDNLITRLVLQDLSRIQGKNWLLDGYPRTRVQAEELYKRYDIHMAIKLVVPFDVIIDRVKGRWVHVPSGRVYNTTYNAPKVDCVDDVTGEPLEQRPDDKPEAVRKRLEIYEEHMKPVVDFFREKNILHFFEGNTSDEIWPKVEKALIPYLGQ